MSDEQDNSAIVEELAGQFEDNDAVDVEALAALDIHKPEEKPEDTLAKAEKEIDDTSLEEEDFDPLKALEEHAKKENEKAEEDGTLEKDEKDQPDTSSEDKDKVEERGEEKGVKPEEGGKTEEETLKEPLTQKELVEALDGIKVTKKVDGKDVELSASEAINKVLNDYAGYESVEKRFSELDKKKQEFDNDVKETAELIDSFASHFKNGDFLGGLEAIAEISGLPPYQLREQALVSLTPHLEERSNLTDEELNYKRLLEQNEYLAKVNEKKQKEIAEVEQTKQKNLLSDYVDQVRENNSLTKEEWDAAFNRLDESVPQGHKITAEDVVKEASAQKEADQVYEDLKPILDDLPDDVDDAVVEKLFLAREMYPNEPLETFRNAYNLAVDKYNEGLAKEKGETVSENIGKGLTLKNKESKIEVEKEQQISESDAWVKAFQSSLSDDDSWNSY